MLDEAEGLWEEAARDSNGGGGRGRRWHCAMRRAPALPNRISGGCHYVVPVSLEGEDEDKQWRPEEGAGQRRRRQRRRYGRGEGIGNIVICP